MPLLGKKLNIDAGDIVECTYDIDPSRGVVIDTYIDGEGDWVYRTAFIGGFIIELYNSDFPSRVRMV